MKKSYKEMKVLVYDFNKTVSTNFIQVSGESYEHGDYFENDDFE